MRDTCFVMQVSRLEGESSEFWPLGSDAITQIAEGAQKAIAVVDGWRGINALSDFLMGSNASS